ncbi:MULTISPECIES: acyltransferase [unclassified Arthrobacter]|uniref:acyltransferase family protein n=1 Tax=unclassified Arthrobacter TaxID=235627 RepID=UPI001C8416DF|nr:acyltransferase [Arthrobacter sp. MAHUQ-56]MBX7446213.1 acyltransferase [Arthrobacter sp. MAHUQ-56]
MNSEARSTRGGRIHSLDGVRGVAALVVLIHHAALLSPVLAATYFSSSTTTSDNALAWWLTYTPLHLLWEGDGAVYIFFVLSGAVLTLPFIGRPFRAKSFYGQRILRLYLPIWAAVLLAAVTVYLVPRVGGTGNDWLNNWRAEHVTAAVLVGDLTLVRGPGGLATPLWSLQWEILFSLALPVYLWLAFKTRGYVACGIAGLVLLSSASTYLDGTAQSILKYMPMFMVGVVMIVERRALERWGEKITSRRGLWPIIFTAGCLLVGAGWYVIPLTPGQIVHGLTVGPMVLGAAIIIFAAIYWRGLRAALEAAPAQWLGKISFSLYLIHEPIIVSLGYVMGSAFAPLAAILGIVISLLLAPAFFRLIELPSHRLSKFVGSKFQSKISSAPHMVKTGRKSG